MKQGVTNPQVLFKDLADPKMIARISQGVSAVEQFQVLTPGVRPFTELRKQQLALKYLDFCEKRDKFEYVNRFKKSYETCLKMNQKARNAYLHHVEGQDARNREREKMVISEAKRVKNLKHGQTELDDLQADKSVDETKSKVDLQQLSAQSRYKRNLRNRCKIQVANLEDDLL